MSQTLLDPNQIIRLVTDESSASIRVTLTNPSFEQQSKVSETSVTTVERPIIVEKQVILEVEKPIIVREVEYKTIEVPVIVEKTVTVEIEKPFIVYQDREVVKEVVIEKPVIVKEIEVRTQISEVQLSKPLVGFLMAQAIVSLILIISKFKW